MSDLLIRLYRIRAALIWARLWAIVTELDLVIHEIEGK